MTIDEIGKLSLKFIKFFDLLLKTIIISSMFSILVVTCLQVFCRFILGKALPWPEEFARYAMIWASFLAAVYVQLERGHLGIDFFVTKLSYKSATILRILMNVLVIIFMAAVIASGINESLTLIELKTGALQISRAIPYLALPVSSILFILVTLILISKDIMELKQK
jgi:TRAP-type C4-dicarboxylate transport system permease small subunit